MAEVVIMPKLGFNMSEGKLIKWYKKEGDSIQKGETLFEIETDKTSMEIQSTAEGVVRKIFIEENSILPVTMPIAIIAGKEEDISLTLKECQEKLGNIAGEEIIANEEVDSEEENNSNGKDYDIAVIGAGPGGYVAAIKAAQNGKRVCVVEKHKLGGVCLNEGCIPTKTFIKSVEILKNIRMAKEYGITSNGQAEINLEELKERKELIVKQLTGGVEALLNGNGVTIMNGQASFIDKNTLQVENKIITAENIIIATGSQPFFPSIKISKDAPLMTSTEALDLDYIPREAVIIGGGVIGIEFAYILANFGAKVTVIELLDRILPMVDEELIVGIQGSLEDMGVTIVTGAKVKKIDKDHVVYELNNEEQKLKTEMVLLSVGRKAQTEGLNLDRINIKMNGSAIETDQYLRTNIEGIYAIGDVNGKSMLAHTASMEGIIAVENICGKQIAMDYSMVPSCIYLNPEVASIGLTEEQAKQTGKNIKVGKFPLSANGKALVEGENRGLIKVIIDETLGEILGAHVFGAHATEIISEIAVAMKAEATIDEMIYSIHPHPTISEIIGEAFHSAGSGSIHSL